MEAGWTTCGLPTQRGLTLPSNHSKPIGEVGTQPVHLEPLGQLGKGSLSSRHFISICQETVLTNTQIGHVLQHEQ